MGKGWKRCHVLFHWTLPIDDDDDSFDSQILQTPEIEDERIAAGAGAEVAGRRASFSFASDSFWLSTKRIFVFTKSVINVGRNCKRLM